jgi:rhamnosyltransferase
LKKIKKKIIVLIAAFNGEKWIRSQIETILNQSKINPYIIISDDNSSDKTAKIVDNLRKTYSNISLIKNTKSSGSAGANYINLISKVKVDKFKYVALSDQDDLWHHDKILNAIIHIDKYNSAGYSSSVEAFWQTGRKKIIKLSTAETASDFLFEGAGQGCTFTLPINTFKKVQKFCIKYKSDIKDFYYHDWLIYILVRSWKGKWVFDKTPSMYYRQHQANDTGSRGTFASIVKRFEKIRNGWYKKQISIALRIYFLAAIEKNNLIFHFSKFFNQKDSIKRRLLMAKFVWVHGRRRFSDRCVLVLASILGYI